MTNEEIKNPQIKKIYKTRELNWWQKLLQVYWFNPKSWLLDEFSIDNTLITVKLKNGNEISAPVDKIKVKLQADKNGRRECYLSTDSTKLHFKEIMWMLTEQEWDEVFEIFAVTENTTMAKTAWLLTIAKKVMEFVE